MTEENDIESRKQELFATITLLAGTKRDLVGARGERRFALIERQAQLEADKERLSHEVNSQYMYRNLQAFMNRVDEYDGARQNEAKETHNGLAALSGQFRGLADDVAHLKLDMRESQDDRKTIHSEIAGARADVAGIDTKLAALETKLDAYIAGSKRAEVEDLRREIDALKRTRD